MRTATYFNKKVEERVPISSSEEERVYNVDTWYPVDAFTARYKGEWKNGKPNGKGMKQYNENNSYIEGNFVDGFLEGHGKEIFDKQPWDRFVPYYEGEFKRDQCHGKGKHRDGAGDSYYKNDWVYEDLHENKDKEVEEEVEEVETSETVASLEEVVASSNEVVEDMETLKIYEFEGTGEQLRRLRAYNPKNDGETEEDYVSRIWSMAHKEDAEEEERKKIASANEIQEVKVEEVKVEEVKEKIEEKDVNTWYTIEDGKCRYKGNWKNGLPNGKGIKHFYNTDSYIDGNFVDGFADGYGKHTFEQTWEKTQPYYEGEIKRNLYQGKGIYYYGDGDYYKGMWKDGKYNGQGAAYSLRLDRTWVGEYKNDEKVDGNWVRGEI
jgi:hypothetical protein